MTLSQRGRHMEPSGDAPLSPLERSGRERVNEGKVVGGRGKRGREEKSVGIGEEEAGSKRRREGGKGAL